MTTVGWIGIGIFVLLMVLVFVGVPIWVSMLGCAFLGFMLIGGPQLTQGQFTQAPLTLGANYTYAVLPLFMLVGALAGETGIAQGAFDAMNKWIGRTRGGLLYALVGANAVFGACSGISVAGNVVFCKIAMPELEKHKYDRRLSLGAIVGAGALSSLIPPSVPIIIFCLMTDLRNLDLDEMDQVSGGSKYAGNMGMGLGAVGGCDGLGWGIDGAHGMGGGGICFIAGYGEGSDGGACCLIFGISA